MEQLNYNFYGQGRVIIILHGLMGSGDNWASVAKNLAKKYRVIAVDLRNHGNSFHSSSHSYQAMAEDVLHLVEKLDIQKFHLLGHSMGGKTAMTLAGKRPDLISKLVVVEMAPKVYQSSHMGLLKALKSVDLTKLSNRDEASKLLKPEIRDLKVRQFLIKGLYRKDDNTFGWRFNLDILIQQYDNLLQSPRFEPPFLKPTLFIKGGDSQYILETDLELIRKGFPIARLATISDAGHWPHFDQPGRFLEELTQFLEL
ncbi:MAG: alpha/beta fold hydrolase [Proteobacteria bacterium]|nr:alpha/beta fold hydrolase [Pseudomonadota bacterium]